jgi:hypothetical protein
MHGKINKNGAVAIRISGLSNNIHDFEFVTRPDELNLPDQFREKIVTKVEIEKSAHQIYLKAGINTTGFFQCDRCLEEFRHPFDLDTYVYIYSERWG